MSEYQYYEFLAIDEPLTPKQMAELRSWSTRATITQSSFVNEYHWGDLKGDPIDWMRRYFDAHIYVANWCACCLILRLPRNIIDAKTLQAFATEAVFLIKRTKTHWLLEWALNEGDGYDRFAMEDGRGWMGRLVPLRDELLRGDRRPLYLGWLAGVCAGEVDDDAIEPPLPPGLSRLTAAQKSLVGFIDIDADLLAAAGMADPNDSVTEGESEAELDAWIARLPAVEKAKAIKLLLQGKTPQAERELKTRFSAWERDRQPLASDGPRRRTVAMLRVLAASVTAKRKKRETEKRKQAEARRKVERETYLRKMAKDFERCWRLVDKEAQGGIASAYIMRCGRLPISRMPMHYATRGRDSSRD